MIKKYHFTEIPSTNDSAKELLKDDDLILAYADYQTAGRGRNENKWFGNKRENIYCTFGVRHKRDIPINQVIIYQAIGALIVAEALRKATNNKLLFKVKYPNDVMALMPGGIFGKICGVLAEHTFKGNVCTESIIGIGVNINQTEFHGVTNNIPTSLKLLTDKDFDIDEVLGLMIDSFLRIYDKEYSELFKLWNSELNFVNKSAKIRGKEDNYTILNLEEEGTVKLLNTDTKEIEYIDNGDSIRYDLR